MTTDNEANQLLETLWKTGNPSEILAGRIRTFASDKYEHFNDPVVCARVCNSLSLLPSNDAWARRLAPFYARTLMLLNRQLQADQLGDPNTAVEAFYELLHDDIEGLNVAELDPNALHSSRTSSSHAKSARQLLDAIGLQAFNREASREFDAVVGAMNARAWRFGCHAMFADSVGRGHTLGVQVRRGTDGRIHTPNDADGEMVRQADSVLHKVFAEQGADWMIEWDISFGGHSIGLPLWIAAQVDVEDWVPDPLVAATGRIGPDGAVHGVGDISAKVRAAASHGFRRILVPTDNLAEAREAIEALATDHQAAGAATEAAGWWDRGVRVIGISDVNEVRPALAKVDTSAALGHDGMVRLLTKYLPQYRLDLVSHERLKDRERLKVADAVSVASVDVQHSRRATVVVGGSGSAKAAAERLVADQLPASRIQPRPNLPAKVLGEDRKAKLLDLLAECGATPVEVKSEHEMFRFVLADAGSNATITGWKTGSVVVQGTAPAWDRLADELLDTLSGLAGVEALRAVVDGARDAESEAARSGPAGLSDAEAASDGRIFMPHIGTDEAGKGDYFGPLVCAACFVDEEIAERLQSAGVRDSKKLSDSSVQRLAAEIRTIVPAGRWSVVAINPGRYNALQAEMKGEGRGLNSLVAWGHAKCIHQLADHGVWAPYVLVDKFADESFFDERARVREGVVLELRTKAESDIAVAAASILARDRFLKWLRDTSESIGMPLPKGAGPPVIAAAKELVAAHGPGVLDKYAKVSFKTTKTVLGG